MLQFSPHVGSLFARLPGNLSLHFYAWSYCPPGHERLVVAGAAVLCRAQDETSGRSLWSCGLLRWPFARSYRGALVIRCAQESRKCSSRCRRETGAVFGRCHLSAARSRPLAHELLAHEEDARPLRESVHPLQDSSHTGTSRGYFRRRGSTQDIIDWGMCPYPSLRGRFHLWSS